MEDKGLGTHAAMTWERVLDRVFLFAAAAVALMYLYTAKEGQLPLYQQRGVLLVFCLIVIYVKYPMLKVNRVRPRWSMVVDAALAIVTILSVFQLIRNELTVRHSGYYIPTSYDIALGMGLVVAVVEATRRVIGLVLPVVVIVFFLYIVFGHYLPGVFRHLPIGFDMAVYYTAITTDGIFGLPLYVMAGTIVTFLIFAAMLQKLGLMSFFIDLANGLMSKYRGGPAKVAVISSAFMATMSGSTIANVVSTGSFTIPLMKSIGYRADFAGAVEACASHGGTITPPVMGAAAFIIADTLGIAYWQVCVAAAIPAVLFFWGVYIGVDLEAMKNGLRGLPKEQVPSVRRVLLEKGYMVAPLFVLVYFLGYVRSSAMLAAFWGVVSVLLVSLIKKETRRRMYGLGLVEGLADGIKTGLVVVTACASAGIVIGALYVTGLGLKMSAILIGASGDNVLVLLILSAIVCLILGLGIGLTPIYIMVAMVVAPALIKMGVAPLAAHLFIFFYANQCSITPPFCTAVFAATAISGGRIFPTAIEACKLGAVLFVLPFFFCYNPNLIMQGSPSGIVISTATALIGVAALASAFANCTWWGRTGVLSRILLGLGGLALIYPAVVLSLLGLGLVGIAVLFQVLQNRKRTAAAPESVP